MREPRYTDKRRRPYVSAEESRKPGYLERRMAVYRKELSEERAKKLRSITVITTRRIA